MSKLELLIHGHPKAGALEREGQKWHDYLIKLYQLCKTEVLWRSHSFSDAEGTPSERNRFTAEHSANDP